MNKHTTTRAKRTYMNCRHMHVYNSCRHADLNLVGLGKNSPIRVKCALQMLSTSLHFHVKPLCIINLGSTDTDVKFYISSQTTII